MSARVTFPAQAAEKIDRLISIRDLIVSQNDRFVEVKMNELQ